MHVRNPPNEPYVTPASRSSSTSRRVNLHLGASGVPLMNAITGAAVTSARNRVDSSSSGLYTTPPPLTLPLPLLLVAAASLSTLRVNSGTSAPSSRSTTALPRKNTNVGTAAMDRFSATSAASSALTCTCDMT